jgi:hypothetical protein
MEANRIQVCQKTCAAITMGCLSQRPFELCCNVIAIHRDRLDLHCDIIRIILRFSLVITMSHNTGSAIAMHCHYGFPNHNGNVIASQYNHGRPNYDGIVISHQLK